MSDNSCVTVKNVIGSGKHPTSQEGDIWKEHWETNSQLPWPKKCQCCSKEAAQVGGHVIVVGAGMTQYILPMCRSCNGKPGETFSNVDTAYLVPVVV